MCVRECVCVRACVVCACARACVQLSLRLRARLRRTHRIRASAAHAFAFKFGRVSPPHPWNGKGVEPQAEGEKTREGHCSSHSSDRCTARAEQPNAMILPRGRGRVRKPGCARLRGRRAHWRARVALSEGVDGLQLVPAATATTLGGTAALARSGRDLDAI
eukprot:74704-Pleurochrysis_carterae.AAC.2